VPKMLALKASSFAHGDKIGSIFRGLALLWCLGSLWKGSGRIWGLGNGIRTPLFKLLVLGKGFVF